MNVRDYLRVPYCRFRPADTVSIVEAVDVVTRAIAFCRDQQLTKLLVDASWLIHLPPPTRVERFLMMEDWAREARGIVSVAIMAPERLIDPDKFGVKWP